MRDMTAAEGDGCMWNCRLLIQHHCRYCERERERRPVPGESLSDSSLALGPEVTVSRGSPVGVFARTQFSLSLHFSKSGREVWIFFQDCFRKGASFPETLLQVTSWRFICSQALAPWLFSCPVPVC